jgi:hypothetical protein
MIDYAPFSSFFLVEKRMKYVEIPVFVHVLAICKKLQAESQSLWPSHTGGDLCPNIAHPRQRPKGGPVKAQVNAAYSCHITLDQITTSRDQKRTKIMGKDGKSTYSDGERNSMPWRPMATCLKQ